MKHEKKVGYRGQRYEVSALTEDGNEFVVGWTNVMDGQDLVNMVLQHPEWHSPFVVDLYAGNV